MDKEVDNYIDLILKLSEKTENLIVISWALPNLERGYYLQDFTNDFGLTKNLYKINLKIAEEFKKNRIFIFLILNSYYKKILILLTQDFGIPLKFLTIISYSKLPLMN